MKKTTLFTDEIESNYKKDSSSITVAMAVCVTVLACAIIYAVMEVASIVL